MSTATLALAQRGREQGAAALSVCRLVYKAPGLAVQLGWWCVLCLHIISQARPAGGRAAPAACCSLGLDGSSREKTSSADRSSSLKPVSWLRGLVTPIGVDSILKQKGGGAYCQHNMTS